MASENDRKAMNSHKSTLELIYIYIMWVKHGKTIVNHPHIYIYIYISEIISVKLRIIKLGENDQKQHGRTCRSMWDFPFQIRA